MKRSHACSYETARLVLHREAFIQYNVQAKNADTGLADGPKVPSFCELSSEFVDLLEAHAAGGFVIAIRTAKNTAI